MKGGIAIETLRYTVTLAQFLMLQLHFHIMADDPELQHGVFGSRGDAPFDVLWKQLAVEAGSKVTSAIRRIRSSSSCSANSARRRINPSAGTCRCHFQRQSSQTCSLSFPSWQKKARCPPTWLRAFSRSWSIGSTLQKLFKWTIRRATTGTTRCDTDWGCSALRARRAPAALPHLIADLMAPAIATSLK